MPTAAELPSQQTEGTIPPANYESVALSISAQFMKEQYRLVQEEALGRLSCVPKRHNCKVGLHMFLSMRQLWLF